MSTNSPPTRLDTDDPHQRRDVSNGWIARFGTMWLGSNISWAAPSLVLIAMQVAAWDPAHKDAKYTWIMTIGGVVALIATPLSGVVSDRTRSRWGRRVPWLIIGGLGAAAALVFMAFAPNYFALVVGWSVFQFSYAFCGNAGQSVAPDAVPERQYGLVSGVMGATFILAVVIGSVVGGQIKGSAAYLVTAALFVIGIGQFVLTYRDPTIGHEPPPARFSVRDMVPDLRAHPDFGWVLLARLLVSLSNYVALFFLLYFLRDKLHYAHPDEGVELLTGIYALAVFASAFISGRLSDKVGKRKPFVAYSSIGLAIATMGMAFLTQFWMMIVGAIVLGLGWGIFSAVDQALVNEVLPSAENRGRDMGIMALSVGGANVLSPLVSHGMKTQFGYTGVYAMAAALALLGGLLIYRVRSVD